jgi:Ca2+/Na+ antiporter
MPGRERLWTGERWLDWVRPLAVGRTEEVPVGWYPATDRPGFERLWSGEMWSEEIRPTGAPPGFAPTAAGHTAGPGTVVGQHPPRVGTKAVYRDDRAPAKLGGLGTLVVIALGLMLLSAVAQLIANQRYIGIENDIVDGRSLRLSRVRSVTHASHVTHSVTLILGLITAILFIVWFHRAYRNLVRVGISELRFGPGWAIGGWFIPIFNLVRQKQIANDIWKASSSAATAGLARWREMPLSAGLNWWWGVWIASGLLGGWGNFRIGHADSHLGEGSGFEAVANSFQAVKDERAGVWVTQFGLLLAIAAGVLAINFVREVSRMQDQGF